MAGDVDEEAEPLKHCRHCGAAVEREEVGDVVIWLSNAGRRDASSFCSVEDGPWHEVET